jgi:hypothetical protein
MTTITKLNGANYLLDTDNMQITFLDQRFYLNKDTGNYWPSATTILDAYPKGAAFFEWLKKHGEDSDSIRDEAGKRGSHVHNLTERYDNGEEVTLFNADGFIDHKVSEWNMFEKYVEFRKAHDTNVIHNELALVSDELKFGGTLDRVMQVNGKLLLLDIKTSNYVSNHYWLQLAAYRQLLKTVTKMEVEGVAILHLNAKTRTAGSKGAIQGMGWQLLTCYDEKEMDKYWRLFVGTQALWNEENGSMKPKQFSYALSHKL